MFKKGGGIMNKVLKIIGVSAIIGIMWGLGCKMEKIMDLIQTGKTQSQGFIFSKNGYTFHYLTFIEGQPGSGSIYLGKDASLLTLSTIKRWAEQGFGNFNPPSTRNAFINKIEAVIKQIQNGAYNAAENKIANDIIRFMESTVTGPFRNTFGLLLETSLVGVMQPEDSIEIHTSYLSLFTANPYSLQKIIGIICDPRRLVCEVLIPQPTLEDTLQAVSCGIGMGLEDRENRKILYQYLTTSPFKEHKIYLNDYINAIRSDGKKVVDAMSISSGYPVDYLKGLSTNHPQMAIHFPDSSHYVKWIREYNSLVPWVTYAPPVNDLEVTELKGFLNTGESVSISGVTPPDYPVLIVTPEPPESISPETLMVGEKKIENESGYMPLEEYYKPLIRVLHIKHKCEPWWLGYMEIYTAVFPENIAGDVSNCYDFYKTLRNCSGVTITDLVSVDKRCIEYKIYRQSSDSCGSPDKRGKPIYPNVTQWNLKMAVLEEDHPHPPPGGGYPPGDEDDWIGTVQIVDWWDPLSTQCDKCNPAPCLPMRSEYRDRFDTKVYYYRNWKP
jgi:hypothetical protein